MRLNALILTATSFNIEENDTVVDLPVHEK